MERTVVIVEGAAHELADRLRAAGCTVEARESDDPLDALGLLAGGGERGTPASGLGALPAATRVVLLRAPPAPLAAAAPGQRRESGLKAAERELIARTLANAGGNVSEAARRLGLHRQSLQRKLRRLRAL
jgi:DNA-binding NtrC family response regulator